MKTMFRTLACASAALAASVALSQEEDDPAAELAEVAGASAAKSQNEPKYFLMPLCSLAECAPAAGKDAVSACEVMRPGAAEWQPVEEGRFYPLGSAYRTVGAETRLVVKFGPWAEAEIVGDASFGTLPRPMGDKTRGIALMSGTVTVRLPRNTPEGLFTVTAPGFSVKNLAGDSRHTYESTGDGDLAVVRCVTGTMSVEGRHFSIPKMNAANEVKIRTSQDLLFTGLYGTSGDYVAKLDQGLVTIKDLETGATKVEPKTLDWRLSPQTAVRIHRALPAIGKRMSVTVMTFDASGALQNRCAFAEGRSEINSGELGEAVLEAQSEDLAKKAAEASETEAVEADEASDDEAAEAPAGGDDF